MKTLKDKTFLLISLGLYSLIITIILITTTEYDNPINPVITCVDNVELGKTKYEDFILTDCKKLFNQEYTEYSPRYKDYFSTLVSCEGEGKKSKCYYVTFRSSVAIIKAKEKRHPTFE